MLFYRAALPLSRKDPHLHRRDHPPRPAGHRVDLAEAGPRAAGPARAGLPAKAGYAYVVLDGTLIPIDRVAADRPFHFGKHKRHRMNLQVIASPDGDVLWVSGALPGSAHDKKAEWIRGVLAELEAAGLVTLADKGYLGDRRPGRD
jgi:hypothetical protein